MLVRTGICSGMLRTVGLGVISEGLIGAKMCGLDDVERTAMKVSVLDDGSR